MAKQPRMDLGGLTDDEQRIIAVVARKYRRARRDNGVWGLEDLIQEGALAVLEARRQLGSCEANPRVTHRIVQRAVHRLCATANATSDPYRSGGDCGAPAVLFGEMAPAEVEEVVATDAPAEAAEPPQLGRIGELAAALTARQQEALLSHYGVWGHARAFGDWANAKAAREAVAAIRRNLGNKPPSTKAHDFTGERWGAVRVLGLESRARKGGRRRWRCVCDCGRAVVVDSRHLVSFTYCGHHCGLNPKRRAEKSAVQTA